MKEFAAGFIVFLITIYLVGVTLTALLFLPAWTLERSPNTGICYEVFTRSTGFYIVEDSHPVDSSYCEETP